MSLSLRLIAALACVLTPVSAHAEGLLVAPVSLEIDGRSGIVWLNNQSDKPLRAQVRVFRWDQSIDDDALVATQELVASPPFANIAAGGKQVIRLVRLGDAAAQMTDCERTYRILVDEVPAPTERPQQGLTYKLRYSVPVFLTNPACKQPAPQVTWTVDVAGDRAWLNVVNSGQTRAQLASLSVVAADGKRTDLDGGLVGYVLAGSTRRFALRQNAAVFAAGGRLEALVNGKPLAQPFALVRKSQ